MSLTAFKHALEKEHGFVMLTSLLLLAILTAAGIAATRTANTEVQIVRNEQELVQAFYNTEAGAIDALQNTGTWMTDAFFAAGETAANAILSSGVTNSAGNPVATMEVRCIEASGTSINGLSSEANDLPTQSHIAPPAEGSGYSLKYFETRRYGVTAKSTDSNTCVQTGAWKVFNKF